ncbi:unnamed protein product [Fraxinus pennsylvanica]|uniref:Uncharacterized protein n=1 Tax=Fraxinus pennsylvanica TaxID=56036 RepID=A0AAD1ZBU1_9LAMI|nr:unnamed protein product [Fraxinus pennsylvanica]
MLDVLSPSMYEYRWADGITIKKPIKVSAPKYVEYFMDWIEPQLDDESIFPQKLGVPFSPYFQDVVKTISKRLFRVYAHIYHSHFQKIVTLHLYSRFCFLRVPKTGVLGILLGGGFETTGSLLTIVKLQSCYVEENKLEIVKLLFSPINIYQLISVETEYDEVYLNGKCILRKL